VCFIQFARGPLRQEVLQRPRFIALAPRRQPPARLRLRLKYEFIMTCIIILAGGLRLQAESMWIMRASSRRALPWMGVLIAVPRKLPKVAIATRDVGGSDGAETGW